MAMFQIQAAFAILATVALSSGEAINSPADSFDSEYEVLDETSLERRYGEPGVCFGGGGRNRRVTPPRDEAHCLARCKGDVSPTVLTDTMMTMAGNGYTCEYWAKDFCVNREEDFDSWCWGTSDN